MPIRDEVDRWLKEAFADLRHTRKSLEMGDYNWSCFAAQQAVEKALNAYLLHLAGEYVRGHDLLMLFRRAKSEGRLMLDETLLSKLSMYYTVARYPNAGIEKPSEEITRVQTSEVVSFSEGALDEVSKAVKDP